MLIVIAVPRFIAVVLLASALPLAAENSTAPANQPSQQPGSAIAVSPQSGEAAHGQPSTPNPSVATLHPQGSKSHAWQMLISAFASDKTSVRATAAGALRLLPNNARARLMAEKALADERPEVRSAAAASLGEMGASASIPKLKDATDDPEPAVVFAAAHSLIQLHDHYGYEVYYEILTGERKGSKGLVASQTAILKDPRKMAELGIQQGISFIPYAGMGWEAVKVIRQDDSSPLRAAAVKILIQDPDPQTTKALEDALNDKHWAVRAVALEALAKRDDPSVLDVVTPYLYDEKNAVKYTAAAAVLRLSAIKKSRSPGRLEARTGGRGRSTHPG
jgi:HEAT repeat protein